MSIQDYYDDPVNLPQLSPDELLGMMVLRDVDGALVKAKVVHQIMDCDAENHSQIKFPLSLGEGQSEEIISYNELTNLVMESKEAKELGTNDIKTSSGILDHQGPLKSHDLKHRVSSYNVLVDWDDGTQTWDPLHFIGKQIL